MAATDIIHCTKCNRAISPRDWSTLNVSNILDHGGYTHNVCSLNEQLFIESNHNQQELLETASKTISKLENDHQIEKKQWKQSNEALLIEINKLRSDINEQQLIIKEFQIENIKHKEELNKYRSHIEINENKHKMDIKQLEHKYNALYLQYEHDKNEWNLSENKLMQQMNVMTDSFSKVVTERDELRKQMVMIVNGGDDDETEKCVLKFENWLNNTVKLKQYLMVFRHSEYNDIRLISGFDDDILRNEVGIHKSLHRELILNESVEFMKENKDFIEWLDNYQLLEYKQELQFNGILTLKDLKNDIENKEELRNILNCGDRVDIIWNVIHEQYGMNIQFNDDEKQEEKDDIIDDDKLYETPNGIRNIMDNQQWNELQCDLENYRFDEREQKYNNNNNKKKNNNNNNNIGGRRKKKKKKKMVGYLLEELILFHPFKAQVIRDWISLKNQEYHNLLDKLLDGNNNKDGGWIFDSYSILFDLFIGCYNGMQREYKLMSYQDPIAVNLVFLNMNKLYNASKYFYYNDNNKRIENIKEFINGIIDEIMNILNKRYSKYFKLNNNYNDEMQNELKSFIIKSCQILWNFIHFGMDIYPKKMVIVKDDKMKYCYFPAVINDSIQQTKIWYISNEN